LIHPQELVLDRIKNCHNPQTYFQAKERAGLDGCFSISSLPPITRSRMSSLTPISMRLIILKPLIEKSAISVIQALEDKNGFVTDL